MKRAQDRTVNSNKPTLIDLTYRYYTQFNKLDQKGSVIAEYIWIDGTDINVRCKARTLKSLPIRVEDIPDWNYDGSSTYQASTHNSEVILKPVALFKDPFRQGDNVLVLCDTWVWSDGEFKTLKPANTNFRALAKKIFEAGDHEEPWFGIEQEYAVLAQKNNFTVKPLGWPDNGYPGRQGAFYCSVGANIAYGRAIVDAHYRACLYAGVQISGVNLETMPGQLEFQVGPCRGIDIGDHLWMARYLLGRVAEDFKVSVSYEPKMFKHFAGSGGHVNFSTKKMREDGGLDLITLAMEKLSKKHAMHLELYGDNSKRLSGLHETSSKDTFTWGFGNRSASVRIPTMSSQNGYKTYIEDRRPASDIDPYVVGAVMIDTLIVEGASKMEELYINYQRWQAWRKDAEIPQA